MPKWLKDLYGESAGSGQTLFSPINGSIRRLNIDWRNSYLRRYNILRSRMYMSRIDTSL